MTNLVLLIADQFRAQCVEPDGDPVPTPHLDALAARGVRCETALSSYPVCSPHRAMLISGQTPQQNGVHLNVNSATAAAGVGLRSDAESWAAVMAEHGMATGWIGKWHLEPPTAEDEIWGEGRRDDGKVWDAYSPPERRFGFSSWYSYGCCDNHLRPHYWATDGGREDRIDVEQWSAAHETDRAIEFLDEHGGGPFALAVSWNPPHPPFAQLPRGVHEQFAGRGEELLVRPNVTEEIRAEAARVAPQYFTAVHEIDQQVGRIVDALAQRGLTEDTVVVFTSDHGTQLGSHGRIDKNVPFEESMRIPLIVSGPPRLAPGRSSALIGSLDMAPTLLGLVGLAGSIPARMVGEDLSPEILSHAAADPDSVVPFFHDEAAPDGLQQRGLRTPTHMWVLSARRGEVWPTCHDLVADPFQLHPLEDPAL
ncbi:MAG: sulfatase, partial [Brachybacterium sp.]|nr:sulfatase [Brachybacterium sp.]